MIKRLFDILIAFHLILFFLPALIIIFLLILIFDGRPIIFQQIRIGKGEREFNIYKFRTMKNNSGSKITIGNDERITKIGKYLRKYKLDELPQLFNIIKGDMSLVGARPEVPEYVAKYSARDREIIFKNPVGLTDIASLRFKNESEILGKYENATEAYEKIILPKKLRYYRFYAKKQSISLDIWILWQTFVQIFLQKPDNR